MSRERGLGGKGVEFAALVNESLPLTDAELDALEAKHKRVMREGWVCAECSGRWRDRAYPCPTRRLIAEVREWREWACWACGHGEHESDICPRCEWICIHGERLIHKPAYLAPVTSPGAQQPPKGV